MKWNYFGRWHLLFAFLRMRWKAAIRAILCDFLANLCLVGLSLLLGQAVAVIFNFRSVRGSLLSLQEMSQNHLLWSFALVAVLKLLLDVYRLRLRGQLTEGFAHSLRLKAFEFYLQRDLRPHESRDSGHSLLRFGGDLGSAQQLLARGVLQYTADLSLLLLGLALIAFLASILAVAVLLAVLVAFIANYWLRKRIRSVESARRNKKSGLLAFVNATLRHLLVIQVLNRNTRTEQDFDKKALQILDLGYKYHNLAAWQAAIPPFFSQILLLSVLCFGWSLDLKPMDLFVVVVVLMTWRSPLSRLLRVGLIWEKGTMSLDKFEALLPAPANSEQRERLKKTGSHVLQVQDVDFSFENRKIFSNLNFRLESGQQMTIHLPTGGGKTTLVKMLSGLYKPDAGLIEWDGVSIHHLSAYEIRRLVAPVSDTFPLTGRTLHDALSPSRKAESLAATREAFEQFQILFPQLDGVQLAQKIGGRSIALSTGQQRLLQCLRAILSNKPWLILDDPFAGLDDVTESALRNYLQKNTARKGVLYLTPEK